MTAALHANYGPSSAQRWMSCTASVDLIAEHFPDGDESSIYAQEGTWAHELFELLATGKPIDEWEQTVPTEYHQEMHEHVANLMVQVASLEFDFVMYEKRVYTPAKEVWGTADVIGVKDDTLYVIDLKYGRGVPVPAEDNPQLQLYAIGALELIQELWGDFSQVRAGIYQPRGSHGDQIIWSQDYSTADLYQWFEDEVRPAINPQNPVFAPSPDACRFCPAAGICTARMEQQTQQDFEPVGAMTSQQLAQALDKVEELEAWIKQVKAAALTHTVERGNQLPGWKVVLGNGRRTIPDQEQAIKTLMRKGLRKMDITKTSLVTLAQLEKLAGGKDALATKLGDLLTYTPGKPSLAPASDPRPEYRDASTEFSVVED